MRLSFLRDASDIVEFGDREDASLLLEALESRARVRELSKIIQGALGLIPAGFDSYFLTRLRKLLIEVYQVFLTHCADEEVFQKYFVSTRKTCIARFVTE